MWPRQGLNTSLMINPSTAGTFLVINSQLGPQVNVLLQPLKSMQPGAGESGGKVDMGRRLPVTIFKGFSQGTWKGTSI